MRLSPMLLGLRRCVPDHDREEMVGMIVLTRPAIRCKSSSRSRIQVRSRLASNRKARLWSCATAATADCRAACPDVSIMAKTNVIG